MSQAKSTPASARPIAVVGDDDDDLRATIADYLASSGFDVLRAANGLEVLLHVKRANPQVVVVDVSMPRLGGLDALRRIRAFNGSIRVIVITGNADPEIQVQALAHGAVAILEKPVRWPELLEAAGMPERQSAADQIEPRIEPSPHVAEDAARPHAARILVVDDDPDIRDLLEEFLDEQGYEASSVADGASAMRQIVDSPPDVILLDIDMPGLSGVEALPTIRAVAPGTIVIMVSGTTDDAVAKRALSLGAFDYVVKPVDFTYLLNGLEAAIATRLTQDERLPGK